MRKKKRFSLARLGWLGGVGLVLGGGLLDPGLGRAAQEDQDPPSYTTDPAHRDQCRSHLNRIYESIREYQKQRRALPRWLSDLVPDFISDPEILVCPYVWKSGRVKKWREAWRVFPVFADPVQCTYSFEVCLQPIPELPAVTCREYKQSQMVLVGFGVPIVRCLAHRPVLNLALDGSLYESDVTWEDNFVRAPTDEAVLHDILLTVGKTESRPVHRLIRARDPRADRRALDLSKHYTATLLHLSQLDLAGKLLQTFPEGLTNIGGVTYDVRGLVHLTGRDFPFPLPERADDLAVDQKCARIHFLHGAMNSANPGTRIATYVVRFQDGRTNELPVLYGQDVRTRWIELRQNDELDKPRPAWTSPSNLAGPKGRLLRLYHTAWTNPHPDLEINRIQFVSHLTDAAPFLVAVTVE